MFSKTTRFLPSLLTAPLILGLVACGGDDGGSSFGRQSVPSTPIVIDASNQTQIESTSVANLGIASAFSTGFSGGIASVTTSDGGQTDVLSYVNEKIATALDIANGRDTRSVDLNGLVQAAASQSFACNVGGTITVSYDIANATANQTTEPTFTAGDTFTISFANCNDGGGVTNGSMTMTVNSVDGVGQPNDITMSFNALTTVASTSAGSFTSTVDGSMQVANVTSNGTTTVSVVTGETGLYFGFSDSSGGEAMTFHMNIVSTTTSGIETVNGTFIFDSTFLDGRLDITFNNVSGPVGGQPTSGNIVIVGSNATLTITYNANGTTTSTLVTNAG